MVTVLETLIALVELMTVIAVVAYLVSRTNWFFDLCNRKITLRNGLLIVGIFGAMSIFGNYSGVEIFGAIANVRDLGPMIAGLVGGPIVGLATGLIGGAYRYSMGGFTAVPCSLATVLSGLFGGLVWIWKKRLIGAVWATVFAFSMESLHMALTLVIARPFSEALAVVQVLYLPMTISNCVGMAVFAYIVDNVINERNTAIQRDRLQQELMQKEIRIRELEIGRLKKYSSDLEATVQKLEIVIDEDSVRKEAEKVMGTEFFQELMNQITVVKRRRPTEPPAPIPQSF
ncbi:MAG: LytS/YhcK type 5TM receptor domain-containing protein [Candidatus Bathyarchaeia archaeon]